MSSTKKFDFFPLPGTKKITAETCSRPFFFVFILALILLLKFCINQPLFFSVSVRRECVAKRFTAVIFLFATTPKTILSFLSFRIAV